MPSTYVGMDVIHKKMMKATVRAVKKSVVSLEGKGRRRAPVDEGTLRASFDSETPVILSPTYVAARVFTGNESSDYAIKQHEHTEFKHPQGGKAKYLEDAVKAHGPRHIEIAAEALKEEF